MLGYAKCQTGDADMLPGGRCFERSGKAVAGDGLTHLIDRDGALFIRDGGLAPFEAHVRAAYSLEPLQGPFDQNRSASSGHPFDAKVGDGQLRRPGGRGPERHPEAWENSKEGAAIHRG